MQINSTWESIEFLTKDKLQIQLQQLTPEKSFEAGLVLARGYAEEATGKTVIPDFSERMITLQNYLVHFTEICCQNGLSAIALHNGKIVAVGYCLDYKTPISSDFHKDPMFSPYIPIHKTIFQLEKKFEESYPSIQLGDVIHFWIFATLKEFQQKGILRKMLHFLVLNIKKHTNFKLGVAECTGSFSERAFSSEIGFFKFDEVKYSNSDFPGLDLEIHPSCVMKVIKLSEENKE